MVISKEEEIARLYDSVKTKFPDGCKGMRCANCVLYCNYKDFSLKSMLCEMMKVLRMYGFKE